jgi:DNA/RNA endonuclease YhcR with UshA esterase domain
MAAIAAFGVSSLYAADSAKKTTAIDATDKDAVLAAMPHEVTVVGTISDIKDNEGVTMINFAGTEKSQFYAVVMKRNLEAVEKAHGEGLKSLSGKRVQVAGKLAEYRDKPQIIISAPEKIVVVDESKPTTATVGDKPSGHAAAIDASDADAVLAALPQIVVVTGTISDVKDNEGVAMINFNGTDNSQFYAVVLKRNREAVEKTHGEGLKSLVGKPVKLTGKIIEYRQKPEIIISTPEQIALAEK